MIFTVLDDPHASLICNDCITEEQLDIGYSETELGSCDECGTHGTHTWLFPPSAGIIIGLTMTMVEAWARQRGLLGAQIGLYQTDTDTGQTLEGMRIKPECVVLLPGSERGRRWYMFEQELMSSRSMQSIRAVNLAPRTVNSFNVTSSMNFQQYKKFLYGTRTNP